MRRIWLMGIGAGLGCNGDVGVVPCMGDIEVGIYDPAENEQFADGMPVGLTARVSDLCGRDLNTAIWSLSSDVQERVVIDWEITDGEIVRHLNRGAGHPRTDIASYRR